MVCKLLSIDAGDWGACLAKLHTVQWPYLPHFELHMASTLVSYVNISLIRRDRDLSVCLSTAEPDCVDFLNLPTWACLSVSADPYKQHGWILCWSLVAVSYSCIGAERTVSREDGMGGHSSLSALPAFRACELKKEKWVLFRECFWPCSSWWSFKTKH